MRETIRFQLKQKKAAVILKGVITQASMRSRLFTREKQMP